MGLGVNFCSDSSFQTLGREKNDIFYQALSVSDKVFKRHDFELIE